MLKINAGPETAKILEETRRSMSALKTSVRRVSSGIRIESAGDDPGAIGSVTFSETAISGVQRTLRNLNDGITVTQALASDLYLVEELLLTLREVAEQAASDQYTDLERQELQVQAKEILGKVDEAVRLAGSQDGLSLTQNSTITISGSPELSLNTQLVVTDLLVDELGKRAIYSSQRNGVFTSALTDGALTINGVEIRPTTSDDDPFSTTANDGSSLAKAKAINAATYLTGVTAEAGPTEIVGNRPVSAVELTGLNYFSVNGSVITGVSVGDLDSSVGELSGSLREAINAETKYTGVTASLDDSGQLILTAEDGRNIYIKYSNQEVLNAIGVTDKEGDLPNLSGEVELASPDRDLKGEVQLPITTDFQTYNGADVSVSGRFDASEDYIDFVAHIVKDGGFGVAEFRLDRDPLSEVIPPAEDFDFIEGVVDPILDTTGVAGDFFSTGGIGVGGGAYNEGLDREYTLTVTQEGTTDGLNRADFEVSTVEDGVVGSFTASALAEINIAGARTGEDVTIYFSQSPRNSALSSTLAAGHEYDSAVTIGGTYNGDVDSTTTIEVTTSGRTQGSPQAQVQVYHDGVAYNGPVAISADVPIDIGNGQTLTFAEDLPIFSPVTATTTGTYTQAVTVDSVPADFTGIGAATYELEVTQAGSVNEARYVVNKDGAQVVGEALLTQGTVTLTDGVTFNIPDAPPTIGDTVVTTAHSEDVIDHYQDYVNTAFVGSYDGALNDTTLEVRVKGEGIVLDAADSEVGRSDYAVLEYRFGGAGAFVGDLVARTGGVGIDHGIDFDLPTTSATPTVFETSSGLDLGATGALAPLSIGGYNGDIEFAVDQSLFTYGEDVRVLFSSASSIQIPDVGPQADTLTVKLVSQNTGGLLATANLNPVSGVTETIAPGLTVTFTNANGASASLDPALSNDDAGVIALEAGAAYNGANDNDEILFSFSNQTNVTVTREVVSGNDGVSASVGANVYNGTYGDKRVTIQLGTNPATEVSQFDLGANGVDDGAPMSLTGTYTGANSGDDIRVEYLNRLSVDVAPDAGNDDGGFSIASTLVGSQDINRAYADLTLDISVAKSVETAATSTPADVTIVGAANGNFFGEFTFWRVNNQKFRVEATPDGGVKTQVEERFNDFVSGGILDLGDPAFQSVFGNVDPGFDLDVSSATVGQQYHFTAREVFDYTFTDPSTGTNVTLESNAGSFDLNAEPLASTFFSQGDPGFDLVVSNEADAVDDTFQLTWSIDPTVAVYRQSGGAQQDRTEVALTLNGDQTQATYDLNDPALAAIFDEGNPDITLVVDQPLNMIDDTWSILGVDPSVSFSDGVTTVEGVALQNSYTLSDAQFAPIFSEGSPGDVVINLTNIESAVNDRFHIDLISTTDVYVSETDGTGSQLVTVQRVGDNGTIDLGQAAVTGLLNNNLDPGFDLDITNLDRGIDDEYTLRLSSLPTLSAQADEEVVFVNQHSLQVGDTFSVDLAAERFAVGDTFSVDVDSEHLQQGSVYSIANTLGKFLVGDEIKLDVTHEFQAPTYVVDSQVSILNGLSLDFAQDGAFEIGDEVRFQVRGYTGDPVASGTYTYAISPTTFTVEVTSTGDVDGGATFKYTRADTGETVEGLAVSAAPTLLDDGVEISFTAGRVYAGDTFYINAYESLNQTFGGQLTLSSPNSITVELEDVDTDNLLGRITYSGATPKAPGTDGNLTSAFLALNQDTAVGNVDVRTQRLAQKSVVYTQNAQESLGQYQRRVALTQAALEDISTRLEDDLTLKLDDLERMIAANPREEGERMTRAVKQNESNSMLSAFTQQASVTALNLVQQSLVAPEPPRPRETNNLVASERRQKATRGEKGVKSSAEERTAAQDQARRESAERLNEMMSAVEAAQQRSVTAVASLGALRQLSQAHIEMNSVETERASSAVGDGGAVTSAPTPTSSASASVAAPASSSFDRLLSQLSASTQGADERAAARQAEQALNEARSYLQEMRALTLEVQASTNGADLESQQVELDALINRLQNLELPVAGEGRPERRLRPELGGVNLSQLQFSSAVSRGLGRFSSEESLGGVDATLPLRDGSFNIVTERGVRVSVRGTRPSDDPDSTRDALGSAKAKANAINASSAQHGVTALAGPTLATSSGAIGSANLNQESLLRINGVEISGVNVQAGDSDGALRAAVNAVSNQTGVRATSTRDGGLRLMASDGRNIVVDAYGEATQLGLTPRGAGVAESKTTGGELTLSSRGFFFLELDDVRGGLDRPLGAMNMTPLSYSIDGLDLTSSEGRADALGVIDLALSDLSSVSRALGLS